MKFIWRRDPELSYPTFSDEGEPVYVEPFTIDEYGRRIRKKPEKSKNESDAR